MSTIQIRPEILVVGFAHLIWITLLSFIILGDNPVEVLKYLSAIDSGTGIILVAIITGASFLLGGTRRAFYRCCKFLFF